MLAKEGKSNIKVAKPYTTKNVLCPHRQPLYSVCYVRHIELVTKNMHCVVSVLTWLFYVLFVYGIFSHLDLIQKAQGLSLTPIF